MLAVPEVEKRTWILQCIQNIGYRDEEELRNKTKKAKWRTLRKVDALISTLKPGFHMIATIAVIAAIANKNGSAIPATDGFHMIAAIAE